MAVVPPGIQAAVATTLRAAGCVFAEDEARLLAGQARTPEELAELVRRRVNGEPLEQILGWAEFDGLRIAVEPGVFVPRRRTRLLVGAIEDAVRALPATADPVVVVDLCCGSGAVAAAVAARLGDGGRAVELHTADIDPAAVRCARRNLAGIASVHEGDLLAALPRRLRGRVDVLAASPPYVPSDAVRLMPPEARVHEPRIALDGGSDGLDVVRRIVAEARVWMSAAGRLLLDLSDEQVSAAVHVLGEHQFTAGVTSDEDLGATVVQGR